LLRSQSCAALAPQAGGSASRQLLRALIRQGNPFVDGTRDCRYELRKLGGSLNTLLWIFLEERCDEADNRLRNTFESLKRYRGVLMLSHDYPSRTPKWDMSGQHLPERNPQ